MIKTRQYGSGDKAVFVLHGGPGAPGYMKPVAERLGREGYLAVEPFQRSGSAEQPLTVERHIEDLAEVVDHFRPDRPAVIVGHSWGAMLGLCYAAKYPDRVGGLVLVGCGTFDKDSREVMMQRRMAKMSPGQRKRLDALENEDEQNDKALAALGAMMRDVDSYELMKVDYAIEYYDALGFRQTWQDMISLQEGGVYPQGFRAVTAPAVMLHGSEDPHPGRMIYENLKQYIPGLEFTEFSKCGHYPWLEKHAQGEFYEALLKWFNGPVG